MAVAQVGFVHPEGTKFRRRQVNAIAFEVFAHVAQEVGQLEGFAQPGRAGGCDRRAGVRPEQGYQQQADDRGRPVRVLAQMRDVPVAGGELGAAGRSMRIERSKAAK